MHERKKVLDYRKKKFQHHIITIAASKYLCSVVFFPCSLLSGCIREEPAWASAAEPELSLSGLVGVGTQVIITASPVYGMWRG